MTVKEITKKLNKKYGAKLAWKADEYAEYKARVESARIETIWSLISSFKRWAILTNEEEDHIDKIINDLYDYIDYLQGE